jgi:hypothetical protein
MQQRRSFRKQPPLDQRLGERAKRLREQAQATEPGVERDKLTSLAQQAETAAKMGEWLSLPGRRWITLSPMRHVSLHRSQERMSVLTSRS